MVFSSPVFLFLFLPFYLVVTLQLPRRAQNWVLLGSSILFYFWGAGTGIKTLVFVAVTSFIGARFLQFYGQVSSRKPIVYNGILISVLATIILPLANLKYSPGVISDPGSMVLPLGISFFTFHAISYVIDVSKRSIQAEKSLRDYLLYLFLFPHQIAGPIVRYSEIVNEIKFRLRPTVDDFAYGMSRFGWGLIKKVGVADPAGAIADSCWQAQSNNVYVAWIGAFAYAIQIYFDFSAYSDMAIGLARLAGFHFPENFSTPYSSASATEFWRRWHMTLSRWFRDYVYIPLGGNRYGKKREYMALLVTFALTSLWHGATWPFIVWGGSWSALLVIERLTGLNRSSKFIFARRLFMVMFILITWVPFRSETLSEAIAIWSSMFFGNALSIPPSVLVTFNPLSILAIALGASTFLFKRNSFERVHDFLVLNKGDKSLNLFRAKMLAGVTTPLGIVLALSSSYSPFLYFQF